MQTDVPPLWRELKKGAATNPVLQKVLDRHRSGWTKEQALLEAVLTPTVINIAMGPITVNAAGIAQLAAAIEPAYQNTVPIEQFAGAAPLDALVAGEVSLEPFKADFDARVAAAIGAHGSPIATASEAEMVTGAEWRAQKCINGEHADPGNTGQCIHCGLAMSGNANG